MKISVFAPFGSLSYESGLIYLLSNYLKTIYSDVRQLKCNGVFSVCDKDGEKDWKRSLDSCLQCMNDQKGLARWSNLESETLSRYIQPDRVEEGRKFFVSASMNELKSFECEGLNLFDLSKNSIIDRLQGPRIDLDNPQHEAVVRQILLAAFHMSLAAKGYIASFRPDLSFVTDSSDYISLIYKKMLEREKRATVLFKWDGAEYCVKVFHPTNGKFVSCEFLLDGIANVRPDPNTWPEEIVKMVQEVLSFLDIECDQYVLPLASQS